MVDKYRRVLKSREGQMSKKLTSYLIGDLWWRYPKLMVPLRSLQKDKYSLRRRGQQKHGRKPKINSVLNTNKNDMKLIIGVIIGHCNTRWLTSKRGPSSPDYWRNCGDDDELDSIGRLLWQYPSAFLSSFC